MVTLLRDAPAWSIAIVSSRENISTLADSLVAAIAAAQGRDCVIDVVVNGNRSLAELASHHVGGLARTKSAITVRIWNVALGDKAHAFNEYIHRIWPNSRIAFF